MKIFLVTAIISLGSCSSNEKNNIQIVENQIDTIACENNQGLIDVDYFNGNQKIKFLPVGDTYTAVYTFHGNFKNILEKGIFDIELSNDSLSSVKKIAANKFKFFIDPRIDHYNPSLNTEGLHYWQILKVPNTIFQWSYIVNDTVGYDYSDVFYVAGFHTIK